MEERDPSATCTAEQLLLQFAGYFYNIQYTVHPSDIPGESAGKSSNVSWAAKEMDFKYKSHPAPNNVLVTVMDSTKDALPICCG